MGKHRKTRSYCDKDFILESGKKYSEVDTLIQSLMDHFKATLRFVNSISEKDKDYMRAFIASKGEAPDIANAMDIAITTTYTYLYRLKKKTHFKTTFRKRCNDSENSSDF